MHIPQPCYENWSAMTPSQHGRICASCNSLVADMTQLSNDEILALIKKGVHCGRFYEDQLEVPSIKLAGIAQWFGKLRKQWAVAAMLTLAELTIPVDSGAKGIDIEQREDCKTNFFGDTGVTIPGIIQGQVLKEYSMAVFGVENRKIFIYTDRGKCLGSTTTDSNGVFAFALPPGNFSASYALVLRGYRTKTRYRKNHYHRVEASWSPGDSFLEMYENVTYKKRAFRRRPVVTGRFR